MYGYDNRSDLGENNIMVQHGLQISKVSFVKN